MSRRDLAIIRLFLDTGMRLADMAGLQIDDLDLQLGVALVLDRDAALALARMDEDSDRDRPLPPS